MKCIIVDDEPIAQDILESYVEKTPNLDLLGKCSNGLQAMSLLHEKSVDLIFLDIHMPELNGLEFLKSLENLPLAIFTTAYQEYALEGYELNVCDYLLKPISFDRYLKGVNKAFAKYDSQHGLSKEDAGKEYIFLKDSDELVKVWFDEILYAEGLKDYVKVICKNRTIVTLSTMIHMEKILPSQFIRIHRSHIINVNKISSIVGSSVRIGDQLISSGKSYRENFESLKQSL